MRLTSPLNAHDAPRNPGPGSKWCSSDDAGGNLIEETIIRGPIHHQIRQTLRYLESLGSTVLEKIPGRAEVARTVTYPYEAVREAVVNAVYHRSYEHFEPTKIYLYPDRIEITS